MKNNTDTYKLKLTKEIDDGKNDFLLMLPCGGKIVIEESVIVSHGLTYQKVIERPVLAGAIITEVGLMILGGHQNGEDLAQDISVVQPEDKKIFDPTTQDDKNKALKLCDALIADFGDYNVASKMWRDRIEKLKIIRSVVEKLS